VLAVAGAALAGWGIATGAYLVFSPVAVQVEPGPVVHATVTRTAIATVTVSRTRTVTVEGPAVRRTVFVPGPTVYRTVTVTAGPAAPASP
jgi:hypothetical protein